MSKYNELLCTNARLPLSSDVSLHFVVKLARNGIMEYVDDGSTKAILPHQSSHHQKEEMETTVGFEMCRWPHGRRSYIV